MNTLFIIPARGGSKGIPRKNIKSFAGQPLISYSIDIAKKIAEPKNILVTTDDLEIADFSKKCGVAPPFIRPKELAMDDSSSYDVYIHAINYYESIGVFYDSIVILQPTSPFRNLKHVKEAMNLFNSNLDMVVSVKETKANPYYLLFEENDQGFLNLSKPSTITRRQDCPPVYEYNGAVYVINVSSIKKSPIYKFKKIRKYLMSEKESMDLDTDLDWKIAEFILKTNQ